jgi:hypothetical protein
VEVIFSCENTEYMWWQAEFLHYTYRKVGMKAQLIALVSQTDEAARQFSSFSALLSNYKNYLGAQPYPPLNKPGGISEWLATDDSNDDPVLIVDPDSVFVDKVFDPGRLPDGVAYAEAHDYMASDLPANKVVLERHCRHELRSRVQPVGIYILINKRDLRRLAPLWFQKSIDIRSDSICRRALPDDGWVSEMWGYTIAAAELGICHHICRLSQVTGSNCLDYPITHYCYPLAEHQDRIWTRSQQNKVLWSKWSYQPWELPPASASITIEGSNLLNCLAELVVYRTNVTRGLRDLSIESGMVSDARDYFRR